MAIEINKFIFDNQNFSKMMSKTNCFNENVFKFRNQLKIERFVFAKRNGSWECTNNGPFSLISLYNRDDLLKYTRARCLLWCSPLLWGHQTKRSESGPGLAPRNFNICAHTTRTRQGGTPSWSCNAFIYKWKKLWIRGEMRKSIVSHT